jgi:CRISPR/Cas system CSM-associated protein Csm2 small subunit
MIAVCPHCLHPVIVFDRDYMDGEVKAVKVDVENSKCSVLLASNVYQNAKCSNIQQIKVHAGKIAKELNLSEEQKKEFFNNIIKLKREHNRWKDYKILETALNSIIKVVP